MVPATQTLLNRSGLDTCRRETISQPQGCFWEVRSVHKQVWGSRPSEGKLRGGLRSVVQAWDRRAGFSTLLALERARRLRRSGLLE